MGGEQRARGLRAQAPRAEVGQHAELGHFEGAAVGQLPDQGEACGPALLADQIGKAAGFGPIQRQIRVVGVHAQAAQVAGQQGGEFLPRRPPAGTRSSVIVMAGSVPPQSPASSRSSSARAMFSSMGQCPYIGEPT